MALTKPKSGVADEAEPQATPPTVPLQAESCDSSLLHGLALPVPSNAVAYLLQTESYSVCGRRNDAIAIEINISEVNWCVPHCLWNITQADVVQQGVA